MVKGSLPDTMGFYMGRLILLPRTWTGIGGGRADITAFVL
jgi:hypothetical protein